MLTGPMHAAKAQAVLQFTALRKLAHTVGGVRGLFGDDRPTDRLGKQVAWAERATETYRRGVVELLDRMDGHLQLGSPPVDAVLELGVQRPWEVDGAEVATELERVVGGRIDGGASLAALAEQMRRAAAVAAPQGCAAALEQVRARGPVTLPMPPFPVWPLPLTSVPVTAVTCALTAFFAGPGLSAWLFGGLLALLWFATGWFLLGRRPEADGEAGFGPALPQAAPVYGLPALLGTVAGALADPVAGVSHDSPALVGHVVLLLSAGTCLASAVLGWRSAARRWRAKLTDESLHAAVEEFTAVAERAVADEWLPLRRRQGLAAAAGEVGSALTEVAETLADAGNRLFIAPTSSPRPARWPGPCRTSCTRSCAATSSRCASSPSNRRGPRPRPRCAHRKASTRAGSTGCSPSTGPRCASAGCSARPGTAATSAPATRSWPGCGPSRPRRWPRSARRRAAR
ncbi:hypothetical protein ACFQV2_03700 [Actinokineospora soli]|uniref:Uncharacterized protein n=1 Tax=Actinokineospora soli TaxID=1048753 RepID=A0ABW2TIJ3_9PSEU